MACGIVLIKKKTVQTLHLRLYLPDAGALRPLSGSTPDDLLNNHRQVREIQRLGMPQLITDIQQDARIARAGRIAWHPSGTSLLIIPPYRNNIAFRILEMYYLCFVSHCIPLKNLRLCYSQIYR